MHTTFSVVFCSRWVCLLNGMMLKSCLFCLQIEGSQQLNFRRENDLGT